MPRSRHMAEERGLSPPVSAMTVLEAIMVEGRYKWFKAREGPPQPFTVHGYHEYAIR